MRCEFDYCIYNKKLVCILEEVQIDSLGMCESCELITVPQKSLSRYKNRRLKDIESVEE